MKKHYIFYFLLSCFLAGCNNNETSIETNENVYATINSKNDVIYVYGLVNDEFDLSKIDTSRVTSFPLTYSCDDEKVSVINDKVTFNDKGVFDILIEERGNKIGLVHAIINENKNNQYDYPYFDINEYHLRSGSASNIAILDDKISIAANSTWHRITYPIDKYSSLNYSVSCDVTFKQTSDNSRWFGIVFRNTSSNEYYQFDIRRNPTLDNAIELTYVTSDGQYSYPYTSKWDINELNEPFDSNVAVHMEVSLDNYIASCHLSYKEYSKTFDVNLPTLINGEFGFQTTNSTVEIENIKISMNKEIKKSSFANTKESYVNINDNSKVDANKPQLILSGEIYDELFLIYNDYQQVYVKAKENNGIDLYDINDNLMDINLNKLIEFTYQKKIINVQIEDVNTLNTLAEIFNSFGLVDACIWSTNEDILKQAHKILPQVRLGYIPLSIKSFSTIDEIGSLCRKAGLSYSNQLLIDSTILNKDNVNIAKGLGYNIVANANNGNNYSVIDSALDGCSLILVSANPNTRDQVKLLYDDTIFDVSSKKQSLFSAPYVTGHRGSGNTGANNKTKLPENTIESFKLALDNGANAIELDVHTTADEKLAVIHNDSTGEYSNANLKISSSTLSQLQSLPLKMGDGSYSYDYKISSLEEVFDALNDAKYKDKTMVIEIKDNLTSTGIKAINIAKEKNWYNRITLITFSSSAAREIKKYDPSIQVGYLGTVYRNDNEQYWQANNSYYNLGVGIAANYGTVSKESIQECNARGQIEWLWTFNSTNANELLKFISYGNKAFTTNYVSDFSNNYYKLEADSFKLNNNETKQITANAISYNGNKVEVNDVKIIVLSNNATANNNSITRTNSQDIYIVLKYETTWVMSNLSKTFVIYSDLIKIN